MSEMMKVRFEPKPKAAPELLTKTNRKVSTWELSLSGPIKTIGGSPRNLASTQTLII
jgi:hypothetical protein